MINAISPIDGRYESKTKSLQQYYSEFALIRERVFVEVQYLIALSETGLSHFPETNQSQKEKILSIFEGFDSRAAQRVKDIEAVTNHDVKAVEYYVKEQLELHQMTPWLEWVHFALTSQDINNTSLPRLIKASLSDVFFPTLEKVVHALTELAIDWKGIPMLAHTHGQPASPTTVGKELMVFIERLKSQIKTAKDIRFYGKFGGSTGNFNAHYVVYPDVEWMDVADQFLEEKLGLYRLPFTTQIDHYDHLAELFHAISRINTILLDLCRDFWAYISMEYFKQKTVANEVGSSAMPHKVNPIDFENAEGNLGIANALLSHLAEKLPVSRLQRDLTDSTVLRNVGVPIAHSMIAYTSVLKGLGKVELNRAKLHDALDNNWAVLAEAIQNILRREGFEKPYEKLKDLTRGSSGITEDSIKEFIGTLDVSNEIKQEMLALTPFNYIGRHRPY